MSFALRLPRAEDAEWITAACQDPFILRYTLVPRPYVVEHARRFVVDHNGELHVRVIAETDDTGVGMCSIHRVDATTGEGTAGYWVAPWARRRGAATAGMRLLADAARAIPGLTHLTLSIVEHNLASRGVAERAGFTLTDDDSRTCIDGGSQARAVVYRLDVG